MQHLYQPIRFQGQSLQFMSSLGIQPGLGASKTVLFTDHFPLILGKSY